MIACQPLSVDPSGLKLPGYAPSQRSYRKLLSGKVYEHEGRNSSLLSMLGFFRHGGVDDELIDDFAHIVNEKRCVPPLDESELRSIVNSILSYPPNTRIETILEGIRKDQARKGGDLRDLELAVLNNRHLGPMGPTLVKLAQKIDERSRKGWGEQRPGGYCLIPAIAIAEDIPGLGESTAGRHMKEAAEKELFEVDTEYQLRETLAVKTGELKVVPIPRNFYRIPQSRTLEEQLEVLAQYVGPPRNHGGKRERKCPDHPDVQLIHKVTHTYECPVCHKVVEQTTNEVSKPVRKTRKFKMNSRRNPSRMLT